MLEFLIIAIGIEVLTISIRLMWHGRSAQFQHKIGWPRIHHSYIGVLFVGAGLVLGATETAVAYWLIVLGLSLIASDLIHHIIFLPLIHHYHYDVTMVHHATGHRYAEFAAGCVVLLIGLAALLTPITPGSWLIPVGCVMTIGRKSTAALFKGFFGQNLYHRLYLCHFIENSYGRDNWRH